MKVSTKARYAVTAMMEVAIKDRLGPVKLVDIAECQGISLSYLEQLFSKLRKASLVDGVRGPGGGYRLGKPADRISIAGIIEAIEEDAANTADRDDEKAVSDRLWDELDNRLFDFLDSISLAEFVDRPGIRQSIARPRNTIAGQIAHMFPPSQASAM